ncbi:MAG: UDP-N-acetylmuramate dehydrogenase, partial [Spirochaetales bacterium]
GGPADALVLPRTVEALTSVLSAARIEGIPVAVIGGGANLLIADSGVRGLVVCTSMLRETDEHPAGEATPDTGTMGSMTGEKRVLSAGAGLPVTELVARAQSRGLAGLEFAAGLPGSVGGAVYMNARCYGREFADALDAVHYILPDSAPSAAEGNTSRPASYELAIVREDWAYKRTPFMNGRALSGAIIVGARFRLLPGDPEALAARARELESDRRAKGHFDFPSAGSLFRNDRLFGRPTGMILDELGFRGKRIGDAMVSPKHANIFVNAGGATAADMLALIGEAQEAARKAFGFELELEAVLLGDFKAGTRGEPS